MAAKAEVAPTQRTFERDAAQIVGGAAWFGIGMVGGALLEYAMHGAIAAWLGPSGFGVFNVSLQVFMIATTLATLALPSAATYFLPRCHGSARLGRPGQIVVASLWMNLIAGLVLGAGLLIGAVPIAERVFDEPRLTPILRLLAFAIPASAMVDSTAGALRGLKLSQKATLLTNGYERVLRLTLVVLCLAAGLKAAGPALAFAIASVLTLALGLRQIHRVVGIFVMPRQLRVVTPQLLRYSWPLLISQFLAQARSSVHPFLLVYFIDVRAAGLFAAARLISGSFAIVLMSLNFLYQPVVTEIIDGGELGRVRRLYRLITGWGTFLILPTCFLIMLVPDAFLTLIGPQFRESATVLRILIVGALINVGTGAVGATILAAGKSRTYLFIDLLGIVVSVGLGLVLIPLAGAEGAAVATMLANTTWNLTALLIVYRLFGMQPFTRHYAMVFAVALFLTLALYPLIHLATNISPWTLIVIAPLHAGLTLGPLVRFRLLDDDSHAIAVDVLRFGQARFLRRQLVAPSSEP